MRNTRWTIRIIGLSFLANLLCAPPAPAVPSYARQTGMTCAACHTVFPELTPFGREFKLNGYVLDNIKQVTGIDTSNRSTLALNAIAPISLMLQISYTRTSSALPDANITGALAKDGDVLFPQQVSFFYAGKIADELGAFIQLTYDGAGNSFALDNTDIRYAHHLSFGGANANAHDLIVGVTLNNNPTVQDVWNTTPAWGFPYSGQQRRARDRLPSTVIDGGFGPERGRSRRLYVAGRSLLRWRSRLHLGHPRRHHPLDSTQSNVTQGVAPYWRVAYERAGTAIPSKSAPTA